MKLSCGCNIEEDTTCKAHGAFLGRLMFEERMRWEAEKKVQQAIVKDARRASADSREKARTAHANVRCVRAYLQTEIERIESDERFGAKAASVEVNAPLALLQVELHVRHSAFKTILRSLGDV